MPETSPLQSKEAWLDLIGLRRATFRGFCETERTKGFICLPANLALPSGQEMARLLMFRTIEELTEAIDSESREHRLEELIDAINYSMSIFLLDEDQTPEDQVAGRLFKQFWYKKLEMTRPTLTDLGVVSYELSRITDFFRNRAWMNNPQDLYFAGRGVLIDNTARAINHMMTFFDSWDEFYRYYVAKDNVLQFRLRTLY